MPYITKDRRDVLREDYNLPTTAGELNYVITKTIIGYVSREGLSYQIINDVIGALEGAKAEFYRRVVVNYERGKCKDNGDVYGAIQGVEGCES